jgi:hypothetical protein
MADGDLIFILVRIDQFRLRRQATLLVASRRHIMESRPSPEISCTLCAKPVDLQVDLCADEKGRAVHEDCYVNRLLALPSWPRRG